MKIYIDGVEEGVFFIFIGIVIGSLLCLILGYFMFLFEYFNGEIDEIRIWDVVLSVVEINNIMFCELIGNEIGLVVYFDFN